MKFIDEIAITVASGRGGPGKVSFRHEAMDPRGGPDGGDGGRGGNVIIKVGPHLNSLVDLRRSKKYSAQHGVPGQAANCAGAAGEDLIVHVPRGTLVRNTETHDLIIDMTDVDEFLLLSGGRGGKGNAFFKTSVNQAPEHAQPGEPNQELGITLELKLMADVGIIGFPNAGKSTLISRISASKAKVADYAFTTLSPNLGVVRIDDLTSFVVADIPGLIPGAAQGAGLGIKFLKHIERTKFFLHLIDVSPNSSGDAVYDYRAINKEIEEYEESQKERDGFFSLKARSQIVVFNKIDTISANDLQEKALKFKAATGIVPHTISAVTGAGVKDLIAYMSKMVFAEDT